MVSALIIRGGTLALLPVVAAMNLRRGVGGLPGDGTGAPHLRAPLGANDSRVTSDDRLGLPHLARPASPRDPACGLTCLVGSAAKACPAARFRPLAVPVRSELAVVVVGHPSASVELEMAAVEQHGLQARPGPLHPGLRTREADAEPLGELLLGEALVLGDIDR
jgi:hypothetical protein